MASLWGAEPFKIVAENLPASGTFTLRGLAPDTRYCFRLEGRHAAAIAHASKTTNSSAKEDNTEPIHLASRGEIGGGSARKPSAVGAEGTDTASCESSATTDPERSHRGGTMMFTNSQGSTNLGMDGGRTQRQSSLSSSTSAVLRKTHNGGFSGGETNQTQPKDRETRKGDSPPGGRDAFRIADDPKAIFTANEWVLQDGQEAVTVDFLHVATPPELPFRLDIDGCGPHLRLSNSNLTVTNIGRKKWSAVRATIGFSSGVHRWKVHIDRFVRLLRSSSTMGVPFIEGRDVFRPYLEQVLPITPSPSIVWYYGSSRLGEHWSRAARPLCVLEWRSIEDQCKHRLVDLSCKDKSCSCDIG